MSTWLHRCILIVCVLVGLLATGASAHAAIDFSLANAGTQVPFSQLSDAIPTAWSLLNPTAVTGPAIGQPPASWLYLPANLAEPGTGNPNPITLGQIVPVGQPDGADRSVWGVFDRLAAIPVPVLLYFDNFSRLIAGAVPTESSFGYLPIYYGQGGDFSGDSGSSAGRSSYITTITEVPEPATAMLLLPTAAALLRRRKHA